MDNLSEIRNAILRAVERKIGYSNAGRGVDLPSSVTAPLNTLGASVEPGFEGMLATGYNSGTGQTLIPFTWNFSIWGGGDVWSHS